MRRLETAYKFPRVWWETSQGLWLLEPIWTVMGQTDRALMTVQQRQLNQSHRRQDVSQQMASLE